MAKLISESELEQININDWQIYFEYTFQRRNKNLEPLFTWLKVIEHSTKVAEGIRKRRFFEASSSIAKAFLWISTFCTLNRKKLLLNKTLEDIIWYKYPRVCSVCTTEKATKKTAKKIKKKEVHGYPCRCGTDIEAISNKWVNPEKTVQYEIYERPNSVLEWQFMFESIYGRSIQLASLDSICFHYLEEIGEVLTAIRIYSDFYINENNELNRRDIFIEKLFTLNRYKKFIVIDKSKQDYDEIIHEIKLSIIEEIADVMSWIFSLIIKLNMLKQGFDITTEVADQARINATTRDLLQIHPSKPTDLTGILWLYYSKGCNVCNNRSNGRNLCQCTINIAPQILSTKSS